MGHIPCSWIRKPNVPKMSVLSNLNSTVKKIPIKISASYFMVIDNLIPKFICRDKRPSRDNAILEKNEQHPKWQIHY